MEQTNVNEKKSIEKKYNLFIIVLSVAIPVVVAILFKVKLKDYGINVEPLTFLPPIYAFINGITAMLLILGVYAIKNGARQMGSGDLCRITADYLLDQQPRYRMVFGLYIFCRNHHR